jgi:hypothetical protein
MDVNDFASLSMQISIWNIQECWFEEVFPEPMQMFDQIEIKGIFHYVDLIDTESSNRIYYMVVNDHYCQLD